MTLPFCADLTLMMILSIVCQAEDGTVVDLRANFSNVNHEEPALFQTPTMSELITPPEQAETVTSPWTADGTTDKQNKDVIPDEDNDGIVDYDPKCGPGFIFAAGQCHDKDAALDHDTEEACQNDPVCKGAEERRRELNPNIGDESDNNQKSVEEIGRELGNTMD